MNENQIVEAQPVEQAAITPTGLLQMAISKDLDVDKLRALMELKERDDANMAKAAFKAAMSRVQEKIPVVVATSDNAQTHSKYAKEAEISKAIKPIYTAGGFSLVFYQGECPIKGHMRIMADVSHKDGHTITRYIDYPYDMAGIAGKVNKTPIHAYKSTFTYGRGTLVCAIFNVATGVGDDDGNGATETIGLEAAAELAFRLDAVGGDGARFLKNFKVTEMEDIPQSELARAERMMAAAEAAKAKEEKV